MDIDQAALAGAATASVIAITAADGPYEPFETIIGLVLFVLLAAYYHPPRIANDVRGQWAAVPPAAVGGLIVCLIFAFPTQWMLVGNPTGQSAWTSWCLSVMWPIATALLVPAVTCRSRGLERSNKQVNRRKATAADVSIDQAVAVAVKHEPEKTAI